MNISNDLKKVWSVFTPVERRKATGALVLMLVMGLVELLGVLSILPFLTVLGNPRIIEQQSWLRGIYERHGFDNPTEFIVVLGLASIAFVALSALVKALAQHSISRFVFMLRHSISSRMLARYLNQPYEFFLTRNSSQLAKNVLSEADHLVFGMIQPLSQMLSRGIIFATMLLLVFAYDPLVAICVVTMLGLMYSLTYRIVRTRLLRIGEAQRVANAHRYQSCNEALGGVKDLKMTHAVDAYLQRFRDASREFSRHLAANDSINLAPQYLVEAVGFTGLIAVSLYLLMRSSDIANVLPALGLYGFATYRMLPAAQVVYRGLAQLKSASATLDAVRSDIHLAEEPEARDSSPLPLQSEIRLQGVTYAYPSNPSKPVLDNFNLTIAANSSIGIAGPSGAGKSTLMDVLLGLLAPQAGTMTVDGIPITASNVASWQRSIGYVPQHIYLADATVAENIAFGMPRGEIDMAAVERSAKAAQIHRFVLTELPEGYNTTVGDRGIRLSGGQRQRLGIARALYRDPSVLFFDEATSALDPHTEEAVNSAVRELSGRKTIVVIAHKPSSLNQCHQIINIE